MDVTVYSRDDWGANPPKGDPVKLSVGAIDTLVVHYSSMDAERRADHRDCAGVVKRIQNFHQLVRGWNDIAYNWLVCQHGGVYMGRGWNVLSAATLGHNGHTQAFCFLGGDLADRDDVTPDGRKALAYVVREFHRLMGEHKDVKCHRDFNQTSCPGDELAAWVMAEGWRVSDPVTKPWPIPIPAWFWLWAKWRRQLHNFPSVADWREARPVGVPVRVPEWAWVRLAAMSPKA
jgi:hypothetical protein